jgi:hypothetical protein
MAKETIDDGALTLAHYRRIAELSERLSQGRGAIYQHQYDYLALGSWRLVAGTRRRRFRFTWDGKDRSLDIETGLLQSGGLVSWSRTDAPRTETHSDDPFATIEAILAAAI